MSITDHYNEVIAVLHHTFKVRGGDGWRVTGDGLGNNCLAFVAVNSRHSLPTVRFINKLTHPSSDSNKSQVSRVSLFSGWLNFNEQRDIDMHILII